MKTQLNKVLSSDQLPSLPQVAMRVVEIAQQDEPDFDALVVAIKSDPAIAAKILKTANSALFGFRQRLSSIERAVPALGANLVRTLVLSFTLARHRSPTVELEKTYQYVWRRSLTQAVVAETLAAETNSTDSDVFFTGGLLQDIGMLALLCAYPDEYSDSILSNKEITNLEVVESNLFGFSHVDLSVELCRRWRLETALVYAISRHHDLSTAASDPSTRTALTMALTAASQCADYLETAGEGRASECTRSPSLLVDHYALEPNDIDELFREVQLRVGEVAALLSVDIGTAPSAEEIFDRAKTTLQEIAFSGQIEASVARQQAAQAVADLERAESQNRTLEQQVFLDPLTGAYNRLSLSKNVAPELEIRASQGVPIGCLFLDIDNFKALNDCHGHDMGDQVLEKVSLILHRSVRSSDIVIRYGGDEFVVVLTDKEITKAKVGRIARRVCRRINRARILSKNSVQISSSVGAVYYSPRPKAYLDPQQLIRQADLAMYDAKKRGGNQVHLSCLSS